jgi:hypothetical protein
VDNNNRNYFKSSLITPFLAKSTSLWHQQSTTAWIEIYKEYTAYLQKISELWSDTLWNSWITKEDDQMRENVRLQNRTDDRNIYKKKKKMRVLILQGGGALGAFQAGAFKALYERLTREDKENGNERRPYLI